MSIFEKLSGSEIDSLKKEVNNLSEIIVNQTVDFLVKYFINLDKDSFQKKVVQASKYKDWFILQQFMLRVNREHKELLNNLEHKHFLGFVENILSV